MSVHPLTRKRFWCNVVVLVALLVQLFPDTPRSVFAQGATCGEASLRAMMAASAVPADANQKLEVPQDTLDLAIYTANWRYRLENAGLVEGLVFDLFLLYSDKLPETDLAAAFEIYEQIYKPVLDTLSEIQDTEQHDWIVHTMLNVALDIPEMAPLVPYVWKELSEYGTSEMSLEHHYQIGRSARRYNLTDQLLNRSTEIMTRVYACAKEIPEVAQAHDHHYSYNLISSIIDGFDKILADNPDLPIPITLLEGIGDDGTLNISLNELKALSEAEFEKLHAAIDDIQESLIEIDKQQDVIIDYLKDQELKAKWQEVMKKKAAEQQRIIDGIKTSISALSTIIGHFDPKLGKEINVVGNASLQVGVALNNWLKATAGLNGLDKITSFSTLVMTGNVLSAVMNVVSLFGESKPTPEEMILQEIGKLRQQVDQLRQEMHSRFDRIDQQLNIIYSSMHDRFNQIDIQLGKINGDILEVQQGLLSIDLKLSRIEHNNYEFLDALGRRPLLEAINGGLGYAERTGSPMPYQPDFVDFENVLHSWATVHAFDPINAGPVQRDYNDAQVFSELTTYPLDSNINYLNGWLAVHNLPVIAGKRLASPRDWLFASRAYAHLGAEWPEHMRRINPQRQTALDRVGTDLEEAMRNISTVETPSGPQGNTLLFTTVISYYQGKLDNLDSSIQSLEDSFIAELRSNLRPDYPFELHGGITQTLTFTTEGFTKMDYGNPINTLPPPSNLNIPNYNEYNLADYFKLFGSERGRILVAGEFINPIIETAATSEIALQLPPPPTCLPNCSLTADLKISVTVIYSDVSILNMELMAGTVTVQASTKPTDYVVSHWGELKPRFETEAIVVSPSPELAQQRELLLKEVRSKLQERLATYQQALYAKIYNELSIGALRSRMAELAGGKALLDSFVLLGLPRAIANDEFLHAMLFGNQQLVDDSDVAYSYAISATQPITEVNVLINPRLVIKQTADERRIAFSELLNRYLDAITAQTHVEGPDYIASTRSILNLTMRIARVVSLTSEEEGATVSGVIFHDANGNGARDPGEAGIAGATVTLSGGDSNVSAALVRTTTTNNGGVYTFTGIPVGQYTIKVDLPASQSGSVIPPFTVTVNGNGIVNVPPTPIQQVESMIYLPTLGKE
jgi:hypothetical protein